jgi:hypothetical protein
MPDIILGNLKFYWAGNWTAATAYDADDVVKYGPSVYVCDTAHTSTSEFDPTKWELMVEGVTFEGEWNSSIRYQKNDIVTYGGGIYICIVEHDNADSTDTNPTNGDLWSKLVNGLEWESAYDHVKQYQKGDVVKYGGYTYTALQNAYNIYPTNTQYWEVLVAGYRETGVWSNLTNYIPGDVVQYGGNKYVVKEGKQHLNIRPMDTTYWDLVLEGFNYRGAWTGGLFASSDYRPGDVVTYGARTYVCIQDFVSDGTTNIRPTDQIGNEYWRILNTGLQWKGPWALSEEYKPDDVVEYSGSSYVSLTNHFASLQNRPDQLTADWQALAVGDISSPMTTSGDMIYRASNGSITRLPIGPSGAHLIVNNGIPSWGVQAPERNYYVSLTGDDSNDGRTIATAWRTLQHACTQTFNVGQAKISIMAGTYAELCPIKVGKYIVIEGDGLGSVTISPDNTNDKGYGVGISKDLSTPNANSEIFHVNNGSRIRNLVFRGFGSGAVCVSLDPGLGPNDTSVWVTSQSPYVQNCTSFTDLGTGMVIDGALHNGGYKSIVANDWTQINSDGIGFIVKNDGRSELVSCFTYYCHIGYLCESGGKIRSVGGNNSYGEYGAVARGFSQNETPLTGTLQLDDDTITSVQTFTNNVHIFTSYRDFSGNLFCVGHTNPTDSNVSSSWSNSSSRPFIAKFTAAGNLDWSYTYTSNYGAIHSVVEIDNQYYAGGVIYDGATNKGWILKINASGEVVWQKTVGDTNEINDVTTDGANFLYAIGNHNTNGTSVLKIQPSGIVAWSRTLDYNDSSINTLIGTSICYAGSPTTSTDSYAAEGDATAEDDLYIACRDTTANVAMIVRMDNSGNLVTAYRYGNLYINKLRLDTGNGDGIYMMAAGYYDPAGAATRHPFLMRVDILGNVEWQHQIAAAIATENGEWKDVIPLGDDVYVAGYLNDSNNRGIIARFSSNGSLTWLRQVTNSTDDVFFTGVALDGVNVIAAGNYETNSILTNIQRDLTFGVGTVTSGSWALNIVSSSATTSTVAVKGIQQVYSQSIAIGLSDTSLTLNQSPGITRTTRATRTGFAGIGTGLSFSISGLSRTIKEGSVLQIQGNNNTYFVVSVANYDAGAGTANIGIDPALPSNLTPDDNTPVVFREAFSQVRMTSHDFLDIGTGGFADTNYPVIIQADYSQQPNADREVTEENGGRCFYVTTDQDGNFRVGNYFKVEQSTGRATLSSEEFDLSGLNELQLGSITAGRQGATVNEFSTDGTFSDNSDTAVPTERATKTYVDTLIAALSPNSIQQGNSNVTVTDTGTGTVTIVADGTTRISVNSTGPTLSGTVTLGAVGDVKITGGTNGQAVVTDGSGNLSFAAAGAAITDDTSTNATRYILFDDVTTGIASTIGVSSTKLTFNPSTGLLTVAAATVSGNLIVSGTTSLNGGTTIGDASGDALTINSSAVSIPNNLNFDSNTFFIDATNNTIGIGATTSLQKLTVANTNAGTTVGLEIRNINGVATASSTSALYFAATGGTSNAARIESIFTGTANTNHAQDLVFYAVGTGSTPFEATRINSSGHLLPGSSDSYDLGSTARVWRNIFTGDLHLSNESKDEGNTVDGTKGNWTIQEGEEHLYIINNKNGKKYKFKLEGIE